MRIAKALILRDKKLPLGSREALAKRFITRTTARRRRRRKRSLSECV
jgi:hypothetical protein